MPACRVVGGDLNALKPQTIHTEWGIASTPVIDRINNILYVVRWGYESGTIGPTFRLFALNPTGNGPYNPEFSHDQLGESVVKLTWTPGNPSSLYASDWFTPFRDADRDPYHKDQDLAAGGVVVLPDSQPWNGKTSLFDDLNQITSTDPFTIGHVDGGRTPHIHGAAVYFNSMLFVHGENNVVRVFQQTGGHFGATPVARGTATASWGTPSPGGMPGGILSLSANGTSNGILWANEAYGNLHSDPHTSPCLAESPYQHVSLG